MRGWRSVACVLVLVSSIAAAPGYEDDATMERWQRSVDSASADSKFNGLFSLITKMNSGPGCRRACVEGAPPLVCRYHFVLENYHTMGVACRSCPNNTRDCFAHHCVQANGVERGILTINRRMPGPSIQVCEGDTVVVDLENHVAGQSTAIHWHGLLQRGSPYMDGVPMLTQCPIPEGTTFRYVFNATDVGTYFWHSHDGLQKMDGVTGSLIVRSPEDRSLRRYDRDMQQHVIVVQDWLHQLTSERMPGPIGRAVGPQRGQLPEAILINGRGRIIDEKTGKSNGMPLSEFRVKSGLRYRFRIIHAGCLACPLQLSVQNHRITLIATDGSPVRPVTANSLVMLPGERYDVVIRTNQPVGAYLIHVKAIGECIDQNVEVYQEAILKYEGVSKTYEPKTVGFAGFPDGRVINPLDAACGTGQKGVCISQLQAELPLEGPPLINPLNFKSAEEIYHFNVGFDFKLFTLSEQFFSKQYQKFYVPVGPTTDLETMVAGRMNQVSFTLPPSPVLSQPEVWRELCESGSQRCCDNFAPFGTHRECFNVISVPLGATVEMLIRDDTPNSTITHPIHLHGFMFAVTAMGTLEQRERGMERNAGVLPENPAMKDTIAVPKGGFVKIRFIAKNPGYWLMHCHVLVHLDTGMALVLRVGDQTDLPPVPDNFPRCGDFLPPYTLYHP